MKATGTAPIVPNQAAMARGIAESDRSAAADKFQSFKSDKGES